MANVEAFTVSTIGNPELNYEWTEADQHIVIAMIESGTMPSGEPTKAGDYPFHGQTLRILYVGKFVKGFKGKRLADDAYTERDENGRIIKKTKDTVTPMSASIVGLMSKDGGIVTTNTQLKSLITTLHGNNHQDAYSSETQSLGRLRTTEFLILPSDLTTPEVPAKNVGTDLALNKLDPIYVFSVYALNKAVSGSTDDIQNVKFGVLRMEAVKWGWVKDRREIRALQLYLQRFRFPCHHCDHKPFYESPTVLESHYKQKHKDLYRHGNKCGCGAFFTDADGLKSHRALRSIYRCPFVAGESSQTRKELMESESKKANEVFRLHSFLSRLAAFTRNKRAAIDTTKSSMTQAIRVV
ncbi:hypothetical protein OROMI_027062 [Orobanche minor]